MSPRGRLVTLDRNVSFVNSWQAWLERGEFILAIFWKARSVTLHYHRGGFDKMLTVSPYGFSID